MKQLILGEYWHIQKAHDVRFQDETCLMLDRTIFIYVVPEECIFHTQFQDCARLS